MTGPRPPTRRRIPCKGAPDVAYADRCFCANRRYLVSLRRVDVVDSGLGELNGSSVIEMGGEGERYPSWAIRWRRFIRGEDE
jgi:hypothetical protein